jgi:hypothetical protein
MDDLEKRNSLAPAGNRTMIVPLSSLVAIPIKLPRIKWGFDNLDRLFLKCYLLCMTLGDTSSFTPMEGEK